jgi:hypothetical protein
VVSEIVRIPTAADQLILRCLQPEPADRFEDVSELARAIDEVLAAEAAVLPAWTEPAPAPLRSQVRLEAPPTPGADTIQQLEIPTDPQLEARSSSEVAVPTSRELEARSSSEVTTATSAELAAPTKPDVPVVPEGAIAPTLPAAQHFVIPPPRQLDVPFVQTVIHREPPPRQLDPVMVLLVLLAIGLGLGAAIAWLI